MMLKMHKYLRIATSLCRPNNFQVRTLWKMHLTKDKETHVIKNVSSTGNKVFEKHEGKKIKSVQSRGKHKFVKSPSVREFDLLPMIPTKVKTRRTMNNFEMAHRYNLFPGPLDTNGRPIGKCACGRWEDASSEPGICPNAQQGRNILNSY